MPASGNLSRASGGAAYRETLGYPTLLGVSASCVAVSADISDRWHQRVTHVCGHQRRHSGTRERSQKPNKGHWQPSEGKRLKRHGSRRLGLQNPGLGSRSGHTGREGEGFPGPRAGAERPPCDPARGARAGMHRTQSRWRVGGWVARERAAERGSSRELPPEEQQGPAVSLETCWPMTAAEAVYRGGASPWQQEKPSERLLNAGPRAVGAQRSAFGRGGARRGAPAEPSSWGQRAAGGGRNFFQNLPLARLRFEPGKGLGRAVGHEMGGRRDLLASHSTARPRKWRGR